jgi:hypothetical protein
VGLAANQISPASLGVDTPKLSLLRLGTQAASHTRLPEKEGTKLIQREPLHYQGLLRFCEPVIRVILDRRPRERLEDIKADLEGDLTWLANNSLEPTRLSTASCVGARLCI